MGNAAMNGHYRHGKMLPKIHVEIIIDQWAGISNFATWPPLASCGGHLCWQNKEMFTVIMRSVPQLKFWRALVSLLSLVFHGCHWFCTHQFSMVGSGHGAMGRRESLSRTFCEFFGNSRRGEARAFLPLAISKRMVWISKIESIPVEWLLTHHVVSIHNMYT